MTNNKITYQELQKLYEHHYRHSTNSREFPVRFFRRQENFIEECEVGLAWKSYKTWWKPCLCEKAWDSDKGKYITKGRPVYNKQGDLIEYLEYLPLINGVYGGKDDVAMLTTSYN